MPQQPQPFVIIGSALVLVVILIRILTGPKSDSSGHTPERHLLLAIALAVVAALVEYIRRH